jgi:hypothetical protein
MIVTLVLLIQVFQHVFLVWLDRFGYFLIHRRYVSCDLTFNAMSSAVILLPSFSRRPGCSFRIQ